MNIHRLVSAIGLATLVGTVALGGSPAQSVAQQALVGITYSKPAAVRKAAPKGPLAAVTTLPAMQVTAPQDQTYRDAKEAMTYSNLLAPCMLYTKDLPQNRQLQALGAPLYPWRSDSAGTKLQPRFPLINLAW